MSKIRLHNHKYKVKRYSWKTGTLVSTDHFFKSFEDAYLFIKEDKWSEYSHKIYEENDQLIHNQPDTTGFHMTYA